MTLFQLNATLKILILWAGSKRKKLALSIQKGLHSEVPAGYEICIITEDYSESRYDDLSKNAIDAADCVLMIAAEKDWKESDSATREREYFNTLVRKKKKIRNQFRFIKIGDEAPPVYPTSGDRILSFQDPNDLAKKEITDALNYFLAIKRYIDSAAGSAPPGINLSSETLSTPGGKLAATLWVATFDDEVFLSPPIYMGRVINALRRMKALHSVHSGLGAMIKEPISKLKQDLSPGLCDITRLRADIVKALTCYRSPYNSALNDALTDCINYGLLPTLGFFLRRLAAMQTCPKELLFVEASIERLRNILDDRSELTLETENYDGHWWVDHYCHCNELIQTHFQSIFSDVDMSGLECPPPTSSLDQRQFSETLKVAKNLLTATVQWTFFILVVFSFLHVHRLTKVENLVPKNIESAVEQIVADWRSGDLVNAVVNRSNQMILCLLAAVEKDEDATHAAA